MRDQMRAGEEQTAKFRKAFTKANESVHSLTTQVQRQTRDLAPLRAKLSEAGVKVAQLGSAETALKGKIDGTNEALKRQREQLEKVSRHQQRLNDIRGRYGRAKEVRDKVAGGGMATLGAGAVVSAPMVKTVADYSRFEDAMLGVAKQVDGTRDDNGRLTKTYYEMGDAIKAMGERIPMATTEIAALVEGGARMGIQGKDNLLIFAETAAKAATAFDMPADQLSEDMGKIANIYKIPIKNIEQLGDVINYLDDNAQSKGGDIINVMQRIAGNVGSMDYKQAAALASTFLSLGAGPEVAATATKAMVRELQIASEQPARFRKGLKALGLDAKQLEQQMARDSTGTIMKVLEAVQKLPDTKRMGVMVRLFGKEYGDDAAKLADNLGEYRKQLELVNSAKAKGSMQREADAKKDTLSAQWQMTRNRLFNQSSALGATLKPALVEIMSAAAKVLERFFSAWTKANPQLVATLMKIAAAVVAVVLAALGGLMLMVAATLGPLALARMSVSTLFAGLGSGAGILGRTGPAFGVLARLVTSGAGAVGKLASVLLWLPRIFPIISAAMASTPIGWVLLGLTAIALLVYKFWGPLKGFFVGFFGGLAQGVASVLGPALSALWQTLQTLCGAQSRNLAGIWRRCFPSLRRWAW
ncbi:phage tail tape measure protein [Chromobacterium haemolyticum]|nr:phage tail tape measure protein [Chromobacterium haemolyticum]